MAPLQGLVRVVRFDSGLSRSFQPVFGMYTGSGPEEKRRGERHMSSTQHSGKDSTIERSEKLHGQEVATKRTGRRQLLHRGLAAAERVCC